MVNIVVYQNISELIEILKLLISKGVNVNNTDHTQRTALMCHLYNGFPDINVVTMLIEAGTDVNFKNKNNETALKLYASNDSMEYGIIKKLLKSGAKINVYTSELFDIILCYSTSLIKLQRVANLLNDVRRRKK